MSLFRNGGRDRETETVDRVELVAGPVRITVECQDARIEDVITDLAAAVQSLVECVPALLAAFTGTES